MLFEIRVANQSGRAVSGLILNGYLPEGLTHPQGREIEGALDGVLQAGEIRSIPLSTRAVKAGHGVMAVKVSKRGRPGGLGTEHRSKSAPIRSRCSKA